MSVPRPLPNPVPSSARSRQLYRLGLALALSSPAVALHAGTDTTAIAEPVADTDLVLRHRPELQATRTVTWTLVVENLGPSTDRGPINLVATLPEPAATSGEGATGSGSGWSCERGPSDAELRCRSDRVLAPGGQTTVRITARIGDDTTTPATLTASVAGSSTDPDLTNNSVVASLPVSSETDGDDQTDGEGETHGGGPVWEEKELPRTGAGLTGALVAGGLALVTVGRRLTVLAEERDLVELDSRL